jgi:hypothetical protein
MWRGHEACGSDPDPTRRHGVSLESRTKDEVQRQAETNACKMSLLECLANSKYQNQPDIELYNDTIGLFLL